MVEGQGYIPKEGRKKERKKGKRGHHWMGVPHLAGRAYASLDHVK